MNPATEVWEKVAALMQADMTTTTWNTWFDDTSAVAQMAARTPHRIFFMWFITNSSFCKSVD